VVARSIKVGEIRHQTPIDTSAAALVVAIEKRWLRQVEAEA
jgi:hypothetical protein